MSARRYCNLGFEALEDRLALAGNVTAVLSGSTLTIAGDDLANAFVVVQSAPTTLSIIGFNDGGAVATSINGVANGVADFDFGANFAAAAVTIVTKGGDDSITFGNPVPTTTVKSLSIDAGTGADLVALESANVTGTGTVNVTLGPSSAVDTDMLMVNTSTFAGSVNIRGGGGTDNVDIQNSSAIAKNLTLDTGAGADDVSIDSAQVTGNTRITLGSNAQNEGDSFRTAQAVYTGNLSIRTGGGNDVVQWANIGTPTTVGKKLDIDTSSGDDGVYLSGSADTLRVRFGDGMDTGDFGLLTGMTIGSALGSTMIDAGNGDDSISFNGFFAKNSVSVRLRDGNNLMSVTGLEGEKGLKVYGGSGDDQISGTGFHAPNIAVRLYAGNDVLLASDLNAKTAADRADVTIDMGTGRSFLNLQTVKADAFTVRLGSGGTINQFIVGGASDANDMRFYGGSAVDWVEISNTTALKWLAYFYGGDDRLDVNTVNVLDLLRLDGGPDTNRLREIGFTKPADPSMITIRNFPPPGP